MLRSLLHPPGFASIAVATLGIGIGASTAIFTVVNAVLLRELPYPAAERLVSFRSDLRQRNLEDIGASPVEYVELRESVRGLESVAAYEFSTVNLAAGGEPERVGSAPVTASFWPTIAVRPLLGRVFAEEEDRPGAEPVVVLSYRLWQRSFGSDRRVVGRRVGLNGVPHTVIGVMPEELRFPSWAELWKPIAFTPQLLSEDERTSHYLGVVGRLASGSTIARAQSSLNDFVRDVMRAHASSYEGSGYSVAVMPLRDRVVGNVRSTLLVLSGAVGLVLLIACANVANLLLVRAAGRQRELAVRAALGATRWRIVRQLLGESLALALTGGALGVLLSLWGVRALLALRPANLPRIDEIGIDASVLAFALVLSSLTGVIFGLLPAFQSAAPDLTRSLKEGGRSSTEGGRRTRLRALLVAGELALAMMLLVSATLLVRSFAHLQRVDVGFEPEQVLSARVSLPSGRYTSGAQRTVFYEQLLARLAAIPGVRAAGAASILPVSGQAHDISFTIEGHIASDPNDYGNTQYRVVTPGYFAALGMRMVSGRNVSDADAWESTNVAVINESSARRYFPNENPVGKRVKLPWLGARDTAHVREIVGVVSDVRHFGLDRDPQPEMYVPLAQQPFGTMAVVVRSAGDPTRLADAVRREVRALDRELPVYDVQTLRAMIEVSVSPRRFNMLLVGVLAAAALVLTMIGVYGVISYTVAQRTHEIGVRVALGAQRADVLGMIIARGAVLATLGITVGAAGALAASRLLSPLLVGVSPNDPWTFIVVATLLATLALLASFVPARRAARVDPLVAMRSE